MKLADAIFAISHGDNRLGTCFVSTINGIDLVISSKHVFAGIEHFENKQYHINDSVYSFIANVIDVSQNDIVILLPNKKLKCSKLFLITEHIGIEAVNSLGLYGYSLVDDDFSGTTIVGIKYKATTPPHNNIVATIPDVSKERLHEGLSGSPLIWEVENYPVPVLGMLISDLKKYGEAIFVSSSEIFNFANQSKKIKLRIPHAEKGSIPTIQGLWEFCLDDNAALMQINDLDIYSRGFIHLLQDEDNDELHGTAINLLFFDRIKEKLFATFIYEILHADIIEEQLGIVNLKCTCYLHSRTYSQKDKFKEAAKIIEYIKTNFPENVTLDLTAILDINSEGGIGAWKIKGSERKGEIRISSYRYKFILPIKGTTKLKIEVFEKELKRNIARDYLDQLDTTIYHVIQNYKSEILAQCRATPFKELQEKTKKLYEIKDPSSCIYLSKLCVQKTHRFKRLERKLGANTIRTLYNNGYKEFVMNCCRHHRKIYERLGFELCGKKYLCPEVQEEVYPYKCDIEKLMNNSLLHRFII